MKMIIAMATTYQQAKFFIRFGKALSKIDVSLVAYTIEFSAYVLLKKHGVKVCLSRKGKRKGNVLPLKKFDKQIEILSGKMKQEECSKLYYTVYDDLKEINNRQKIDGFFIWNGLNVEHKAARDFARNNGAKVIFGELANLPGKIFIDRLGTNAQSELYRNTDILNKYVVEDDNWEIWLRKYLKNKQRQTTVPQAKTKYTDISIKILLDVIGYFFITRVGYNSTYIFNRLKMLIYNIRNDYKYDEVFYEEIANKYIFLPLQVSYDTQVLINSEITVEQSIDIAIDYASKNNLKLVIKPHPQETNDRIISKIYELKKTNDIALVNDNTFEIIKFAYEIMTINSTVGLEALLINKKVIFLGKSFYEKMTKSDIKKYIMGYLANIDYFDEEADISVDKVRNILYRMS